METIKSVILFIIGLILLFAAFPIAWAVSALLGYIMIIISIALGITLIVKREYEKAPLILGCILTVISVLSFIGLLSIHLGLLTLSKAVSQAEKEFKKTTTAKVINGRINEYLKVDDFLVKVYKIEETRFVSVDNVVYSAKKGYKIVIVCIYIKNIGAKEKTLSEIWDFNLITRDNESYSRIYVFNLNPIFNTTGIQKTSIVNVTNLDLAKSLPPGTWTEGCIMFQIPENKIPNILTFKVGVIGGYRVIIKLS